ncbi:hypothetical protein IHE45_05G102700 [Dioscorea alata]|uniref:Uncharacterized protein n=1 Tax=Dioscorea alata TaxID=55571 RepID=A0ACB7W419_DIOAL|nr:hypothetical protein IHE45_05G102700 [Dioscorea alata]
MAVTMTMKTQNKHLRVKFQTMQHRAQTWSFQLLLQLEE